VSGGRIVDLSLSIESEMPHFEGTPPVYVAQSHRLDDDGYRMCTVLLGNHAGTHLDAPSHFLAEGASVEHVELDRCVGMAQVLDLSHKAALSPITVADILTAGAGTDPGQRLLLRTDWDLRFGEPAYFTDFPPLAPETAQWFADHDVLLVGLDIPSLHQTAFVELHEVMLGAGIAIIESLVNLRSLTQKQVFLSAAPLKLSGADGAPVRAIAIESWGS
jgi:kynurenine formamidase